MRSSRLLVLAALLALAVAADAGAENVETEIEAGEAPGLDAEALPADADEVGTADVESSVEPMVLDEEIAPEEAGMAGGTDPVPAAPAPEPWDDLEAAGEPAAETEPLPVTEVEPVAETDTALGAVGYDDQGRPGRIHVVVPGDTLWDISNAYLATPWVWPSIWRDNRNIENPHLIFPGNRIWITDSEMRVVTAEEADRFLAAEPPAAPDLEPMFEPMPEPAMPAMTGAPEPLRTLLVSARESVGLVTMDSMASAVSIVDKVPERNFMSQEDRVFIGLGEGSVEEGDQFTIFREQEKVHDPDTGRLLGWHVDILGWLEVEEVHGETSLARIGQSISEIEIGNKMIPREPPLTDIPLQAASAEVDGKISFFPNSRVIMGQSDFVYLNRGELDGLEVGSELEVYRAGRLAAEVTRDEQVRVPERIVAEMLVIRTRPESAVALVTKTETELELGDRFRGSE